MGSSFSTIASKNNTLLFATGRDKANKIISNNASNDLKYVDSNFSNALN